MFLRLSETMLEDSRLSLGAKVLYARLELYQGVKGKAWPNQETLAKKLATPERTIRRWLAELVSLKMIEVVRGQRGNYYKIPSGQIGLMENIPSGQNGRFHQAKLASAYIQEKNHRKESLILGGLPNSSGSNGSNGHARGKPPATRSQNSTRSPKPDPAWEAFCEWYTGPIDSPAQARFQKLSAESREALARNGPAWMSAKRYADGFHDASKFLTSEVWRRPPHKAHSSTASTEDELIARVMRGAK